VKVPCIVCLNKVEVSDSKIIATICDSCLTDKNIDEVGKNFNLTKLKEILSKSKDKPYINQFGECL
jgi:hypothetical protein